MKSRSFFNLFTLFALVLSLAGSAVAVTPAHAAGIVVNTDADNLTDDGLCTLREAITTANSDSDINTDDCTTGSGSDVITFAGNYTITLGSQLPEITSTMTITGTGAPNTIIQANAVPDTATYRVFQVGSTGDLTIGQVTVRHGKCAGSCAGYGSGGGGYYNQGTLAISFSSITANYVTDGGGGIYSESGTVTIANSYFSDNSSSNAGGAISNESSSTMTISNSTIAGNTSTGNTGGGIRNAGTMSIYNSTISGNSSSGGVYDGANIIQGDVGTRVLNLYNTIVANSGGSDGDCGSFGGTVNAANTLIESTGSLACGLINGVNGNIIGSDPNLGTLTGSPAYFPLNAGSPAIDTGDNAICATAPVNNESQNGVTRPQGGTCDIGSYEFPILAASLSSIGANDGWILELTENSTAGGTMNNTATTLWLGDDASDRQYRAILHFDTSSLPDNAVVTSAILQVRKQSTSGTNPFTILGSLRVDARRPDFGLPILELTDFRASAAKNNIATFDPTPAGSWYSAVFNSTGRLYINRTGTTQFKIYFTTGDNDDLGADLIKFYSGNAGASLRPKLVIQYYIP